MRTLRQAMRCDNKGVQIDFTESMNPHIMRKMLQSQANMLAMLHNARNRKRRRLIYWCRQFKKWSDILISRTVSQAGYQSLRR